MIGLTFAGAIYFAGQSIRPGAESNDLLDGYYKHESGQMQRMVGNVGPLMFAIQKQLRQPWTRAAIVAFLSIIIALTCFLIGSRHRFRQKTN